MKKQGNLDVKLDQLISLVAKSLYSDQLVCVRELLANAMDALTKREARGGRAKLECRIYFDGSRGELVVQDSGIGLTGAEMADFLTQIGRSGTRDFREATVDRTLMRKLIGQFGIGIMSSFVISDRLVVESRHVDDNEGAGHRFVCRPDGSFEILPADVLDVGTTVRVRVPDPAMSEKLDRELEEKARDYGLLLPFAILDRAGRRLNLDTSRVPWRGGVWTEAALASFLTQELRIKKPLFAFPVGSAQGGFGGVVYVPSDEAFHNRELRADLYGRGMLIRKHAEGILPPHAFFLAALVESSELEPTMGREEVMRDANFLKFQQDLHREILRNLIRLRDEPRVLADILAMHGRELKSFLLLEETPIELEEDGKAPRATTLFQELAPSLEFRVAGQRSGVTLREYRKHMEERKDKEEQSRIYYSNSVSAAAFQIDKVMAERGLEVLMVSDGRDQPRSLDLPILTEYAKLHKLTLRPAEERSDLFQRLDGKQWNLLERVFTEAAKSAVVPPGGRELVFQSTQFTPAEIPLLIVQPDRSQLLNTLDIAQRASDRAGMPLPDMQQILQLARKQMDREAAQTLAYLNADNKLVRAIAARLDHYPSYTLELVAVEMIHLAYLYSGFLFEASGMRRVRDTSAAFLELVLEELEGLDAAFQRKAASDQRPGE